MKEFISFLWTSAPELMSVLGIIGILIYIAVKVTLFFVEIKNQGIRLTNVEVKLDKIMEYLLTGRAEVLRK